MESILTEDDIRKVWDDIIVLNLDNVIDFIAKGGSKPVAMSNGYVASLSLDILSEDKSIYHLSVSNPNGIVKIDTAQRMAHDILGEGYTPLTIGPLSGCHQFIKEKDNKRKNEKKRK